MENTQIIMPHLWFDQEAREAGEFYLDVFENSRLLSKQTLSGTPSGDVLNLTIEIEDMTLMLLSAGPMFKINPSISFMVSCTSEEEVRRIWGRLMEGGQALMPLDTYDFNPLFGWVEDRFGVSWQLMWVGDEPARAKVAPAMMFVGPQCGRAEEAVHRYAGIFGDAKTHFIKRHGENAPPHAPDMVHHGLFELQGQQFFVMDNAYEHDFAFNEAVSFVVNCKNQEEIDHYWSLLSADPKAEQCGWLKDQFGVSWQIVPERMHQMMEEGSREALERVTQAFLEMKKFDIEALEEAYRGKE